MMEKAEREQNEVLQKRGLGGIDGPMALMLILLIVQIWLVSPTLNAYLGGFDGVVVPGQSFRGSFSWAAPASIASSPALTGDWGPLRGNLLRQRMPESVIRSRASKDEFH